MLLEPINKFSKLSVHKVNAQKSVMLYSNSKSSKKKPRKQKNGFTIFTIAITIFAIAMKNNKISVNKFKQRGER